ncbi:hypothetical protein HA402_001282 [Bradysia odoriphaga]|nr:hypothetical protein HA402_001282 [Bradysia odoriphaga]
MNWELKPCEVLKSFDSYEECARYVMENGSLSRDGRTNRSYPFEKLFARVLREHPVLYNENHHKFGRKIPTKHAIRTVASYVMMDRNTVQDVWATFQKFAASGVPLYVDLVNYVKRGDGNGWIDVDSDDDSAGEDAVVKQEKEDNADADKEDGAGSSVKMEIE